jgi:hypothetical protein
MRKRSLMYGLQKGNLIVPGTLSQTLKLNGLLTGISIPMSSMPYRSRALKEKKKKGGRSKNPK